MMHILDLDECCCAWEGIAWVPLSFGSLIPKLGTRI